MRFAILLGLIITIQAKADIQWPLTCNEPVWKESSCSDFVENVQKDPYLYLINNAQTLSPLNAFLKNKTETGRPLSEKEWNVLELDLQFEGFMDALETDPRKVQVIVPPSKVPTTESAYGGCLFLHEFVVSESQSTCQAFLKPFAKYFYLGIRNYKALCGDQEPESCKSSL